jgi:hypothetical protein
LATGKDSVGPEEASKGLGAVQVELITSIIHFDVQLNPPPLHCALFAHTAPSRWCFVFPSTVEPTAVFGNELLTDPAELGSLQQGAYEGAWRGDPKLIPGAVHTIPQTDGHTTIFLHETSRYDCIAFNCEERKLRYTP